MSSKEGTKKLLQTKSHHFTLRSALYLSMSYVSKLETKSVKTLITELEAGDNTTPLKLNPQYQRDVVWSNDKKGLFIESLIMGITPSTVILNESPNMTTCIDGKQRLTSMLMFKNNELPVRINDTNVYYNTVLCKCDEACDCRVMTNKEKHTFLKQSIPVSIYDQLEYEQQLEIFTRLQNGMSVSRGEKIMAFFTSRRVAKRFREISDETEPFFKKFVKTDRKGHNVFILHLLYMLDKDDLKIVTGNVQSNYASELTIDHFNNLDTELITLIKCVFGPKFLGHDNINHKMNANVCITLAYVVYTEYITAGKLSPEDMANIRTAIQKTWDEWDTEDNANRSKMKAIALQEINDTFIKHMMDNSGGKKKRIRKKTESEEADDFLFDQESDLASDQESDLASDQESNIVSETSLDNDASTESPSDFEIGENKRELRKTSDTNDDAVSETKSVRTRRKVRRKPVEDDILSNSENDVLSASETKSVRTRRKVRRKPVEDDILSNSENDVLSASETKSVRTRRKVRRKPVEDDVLSNTELLSDID